VNVATPSLWFAIPGDLESRTGGYGYDRKIIDGLRARGWSVSVSRLDDSFPRPTPDARRVTARFLADLPDAALVLVDGLAFGAMADEAERQQERLRFVALVHHPLAAETGLEADAVDTLIGSERRALATTRRVIVTSRATAQSLDSYGVPRGRVTVVEPGTERAPLARGSKDGILRLLCVATLVPRKGHATLMQALAVLGDRKWRLTCVGSLDRDPETTAKIRALVAASGLEDRVEFAGELDELALAVHYDQSDLFVLPTFYEGYGMAVAEALARGLPVIATPTGAIPDLVSDGAGVLVRPGDSKALAAELRDVFDHPDWRQRLTDGARRARHRLPTWKQAVDAMAAALDEVRRDV